MRLRFCHVAWLGLALSLGCGKGEDDTSSQVASCLITSTVAGQAHSCTEFTDLTDEKTTEAKAACEAPASQVTKVWQKGQLCRSSGRVGQCRVTTSSLSSVTFVYSTGTVEDDDLARQVGASECKGGNPSGVWTDITET